MRLRLSAALAAALLMGACAVAGPRDIPNGSSSASVIGRMGPPSAEHVAASGGRRLEYTGGTFGRFTWMFEFDAGDRLVNAEQVRDEPHFNAIQAGMGSREVLARIGRPSTTWPLSRQRQIVWSYRYDSPFCQWFMVGMGMDNRVVDTAYGPDPICDDDDFLRLRSVR
ncbi:hypothetical protein [Piscinibacter sp. XHJ-5]|uniref:hypothetical protein n=1 Tax=Piscinibacter sp. XHJ-5 TaxID=3037797 RepID=UPI002452CCBB|nr:hypothetical protein [Piscinibacter sp. XHJ-5]